VIELFTNGEENMVIGYYVFETVKEFNYLGSTIINNNDWNLEVVSRVQRGHISRYIHILNQNYTLEEPMSDYK